MMRADVPADKRHSSMGATTSQTPGGVCAATASVFAETIGQSIANIGPTLTSAIKISVVVGLAGIAAWLSYLIPTAGLIFVAADIGVLADAIRSPDRTS